MNVRKATKIKFVPKKKKKRKLLNTLEVILELLLCEMRELFIDTE